MKKLLLGAIMACSAISMMAELNGDGYYRVQNASTKRYAYLLDNKGSFDAATTSADVRALQLFLGFQRAASDPSTVFYFTDKGGSKYNIAGQGADLYKLFSQYPTVLKGKQIDGKVSYLIYASKSGMTKYLGDRRSDNDREDGYPSVDVTDDRRYWYVDPLTPDNDSYIGVAPTLTANGKYYKPYFVSFPFDANSAGMKAYVVSRVEPAYGVVVVSEVSGKIPEGTAVILECQNPLASDNRLVVNPSMGNANVSSNRLKGVYFDNDTYGHENHTAYNQATMRSLTVKDGKLAFVAGDYTYVPRNEAYLQLNGDAECSVAEYQVMLESDFNAYVESVKGLNPDGYYRLQNAATKRYAYVLDNTGSASDASSIQLYSDESMAVSDPAAVMYMTHVDGGSVFDRKFSAQTVNTQSVFGSLSISPADIKDGVQAYYVSTKAGKLGDSVAYGNKGKAEFNVAGDASQWWLKPMDSAGDNYFGIAPTVSVSGKYYQSFMASFPFTFASDDMKAYIIVKVDPQNKKVVRQEVEGEIPAGVPVIVECANESAALNRLNPLVSSSAVVNGNYLKGVFFDAGFDGHSNSVAYDKSSMRSLAQVDGKLMFVQGKHSKVPRNQAYLLLTDADQMAVGEYEVLTAQEYEEVTGVEIITDESLVDVYNIDGTLVREAIRKSEANTLPHGVYLLRSGSATEKLLVH